MPYRSFLLANAKERSIVETLGRLSFAFGFEEALVEEVANHALNDYNSCYPILPYLIATTINPGLAFNLAERCNGIYAFQLQLMLYDLIESLQADAAPVIQVFTGKLGPKERKPFESALKLLQP
jgi:hypothetical protein